MDEAVKVELERLRDEDKRQNHRIEELEKISTTIQELAISVHTLAHDMAGMLAEQKEQGNRLDALESAPGKSGTRQWIRSWIPLLARWLVQ